MITPFGSTGLADQREVADGDYRGAPGAAREPEANATRASERTRSARRARLQAGALARLVGLHQLRDLVHDHLGPRRDASPPSRSRGRTAARSRSRSAGRCSASSCCMVAFSMAELTSGYPTAGGPYWWAHDLGGKGWSWMTGWFNIVGLIGIVASVAYGAAIFLNAMLGLYGVDIFGDQLRRHVAHPLRDLLLFFLILVLYTRGQHLRRPRPGAAEQHLRRLAPARRGDHHRAARLRPGPPPERRASSSASGSTTPGCTTARPAASASGSSCCRSASC